MKQNNIRRAHGAMSLTMALNLVTPVLATEAHTPTASDFGLGSGNIDTNIIFENNDSAESIHARGISFSLIKMIEGEEHIIDTVSMNEEPSEIGGYPLSVTTLGQVYNLKVENLPTGDYKIALKGQNHASYVSDIINLDVSSKQLNISTNSQSFTYGDLNSDGVVDSEDFDILEADIRSQSHENDLTGDEIVDIEDLTLVTLNMSSTNLAVMLDTTFISVASLIDTTEMESAIEAVEEIEIQSGAIENLFNSDIDEPLVLTLVDEESVVSEETPIEIPIVLAEPVEMAQIEIISPVGDGAIEKGFVTVGYEDENGEHAEMVITFDESKQLVELETQTLSDAMSGLTGGSQIQTATLSASYDEETNVVVISLGTRVVVKTITVTVTAVETADGETDYVAVKEVNFVQDIVPEDPQASNGLVENVVVKSGSESVTLTWDKVTCSQIGGTMARNRCCPNNCY